MDQARVDGEPGAANRTLLEAALHHGFTAFRHQAQALGYDDDARELGGETRPSGAEDQTAMMDRVERTLLDGLRQAA